MDKKAFYELVDIETPDDFKFYDNIENLIESDEEWDIDILSPLLSEIPSNLIAELIDEYFNNLLDRLPDEETDLYTLIYNVSRTMKGILNSVGTDSACSLDYSNENAEVEEDIYNDAKRRLAYELKRFSDWFSKENLVDVKNLENGIESIAPLRDVLGMITLEKLGMASYSYNFAGCNTYELDEYILNFSDFESSESTENAEENDER